MRYKHFNRTERLELSILLKKGYSLRDIGRALKKNPSSVSRELKRNSVKGEYDPYKANYKAYVRRKYSKYQGMKIRENSWLEEYIKEKLMIYWSPEQIAGRLSLEYNNQPVISFKSIYKWLYSSYGQLFSRYLPLKRSYPRRRKKKKQEKVIIPNRISIEMRPKVIENKERYGDFEGDTLGVPRCNTETLAGIVERKSIYFQAQKITRLKYTIDTYQKILSSLSPLSLTLDNGPENSRYEILGIPTYFTHPYAAWEKGLIENTFARLRRFIPKKSSLANYSDKDIVRIIEIMNNTPRKCLGFRTPREVFESERRIPYQLTVPQISLIVNN